MKQAELSFEAVIIHNNHLSIRVTVQIHHSWDPGENIWASDNRNSCDVCVNPDPVSERYPSLQLEAESWRVGNFSQQVQMLQHRVLNWEQQGGQAQESYCGLIWAWELSPRIPELSVHAILNPPPLCLPRLPRFLDTQWLCMSQNELWLICVIQENQRPEQRSSPGRERIENHEITFFLPPFGFFGRFKDSEWHMLMLFARSYQRLHFHSYKTETSGFDSPQRASVNRVWCKSFKMVSCSQRLSLRFDRHQLQLVTRKSV